jgi:hypothetical protein
MPARKQKKTYELPQDDNQLPPASTGGQSGDLQGLPESPEADSESVAELAGEGNSLEAGLVDAIENAPDADASEVKTHEVREDDVPPEYDDEGGPDR